MAKCEADGCVMTEHNLPEVVELVRFPEDSRLKAWIEYVKGPGSTWTPKPNSRVCTVHFETRFFSRGNRLGPLSKNSVPTLNLGRHQRVPSTSFLLSAPALSSYSSDSCGSSASVGSTQYRQKVCAPMKPKKNHKSHQKPVSKSKSVDMAVVFQSMSMEDDNLSRTILKRTVNNLLTHIEDLVKNTDLDVSRGVDLTSMSYILHMVNKNIGLSPQEALDVFQKQVPENIFNSLGRLTRYINSMQVAKKQYKSLLKCFALSLHFYSIPLYSHVMKMSEHELPTSRSIEAWYLNIDKYQF